MRYCFAALLDDARRMHVVSVCARPARTIRCSLRRAPPGQWAALRGAARRPARWATGSGSGSAASLDSLRLVLLIAAITVSRLPIADPDVSAWQPEQLSSPSLDPAEGASGTCLDRAGPVCKDGIKRCSPAWCRDNKGESAIAYVMSCHCSHCFSSFGS